MKFLTTKKHKEYWANRKIDWKKEYYDTWQHPHRYMISAVLKTFEWGSLFEIGVGGGANLKNILANFEKIQVGGVDVNPDALNFCSKAFTGGVWKLGSVENIPMSDNSTNVVLTDMCLIYVGPRKIDKAMEEIKRVCRGYVVLCEFHSTSWWQRLKYRLQSGYFVYDYKKLLEKHGFYDIELYKVGDAWPSGKGEPFRYIIKAHVVKH